MRRSNSPLVVIVGPTASGKTTLALDVARLYNGEIICADSRTVYKGMDIGTAKPSIEEMTAIPHHLVNIVEPNKPFSAADFKRLANKAIDDVAKRGKLPIMVGGTGLYIDSVLFDFAFGAEADPSLRESLNGKTIDELQQICRENDIAMPENSNNKRYLVRAIERGGDVKGSKRLRANTLVVGITTDKEELRQRMTYRAEVMIDRGVLEEAKTLSKKYGWETEAMKANIYRVMHKVVGGEIDMGHALAQIITTDLQLAKRQLTWFKRNPYIIWGNPSQLLVAIEHFVQQNLHDKSIPA